ncbi:DUF1631 domain-containing protein [Thiobacillus sedimenti]|uniref:DUF1631 domain-containing protein n=1 Tax=Thiobacillus sedimenti TaxID=3110231 RepID=A0ABZ1CH08_9PROT|nr:DUF1631 domain-containing protein [Thiobacillus sp. SCUT-2]WRS38653.1 DUF1631 domain-containing protein [Thiobacillus sp. SCUT-2]
MPENSVVVNLNQFERSRRAQVSADTLSVLHGCRDLLIEGATRVLTRQAEAMEKTLLAMAERSPLLETRNSYYSAQGILNRQANELLSACKEAFCQAFNDFAHNREKTAGGDLLELSLVDDHDFEVTLAIDKATSRLRFNCAEELVALDARMAHLLGRSDLAENDNPLGPRALCEALLDGIAKMQPEQNVRIVLLNQFDLVLTTELAGIYQSLNRHLIDRGILPDIKVGAKSRGQAGAAAQPGAPGTPAQAQASNDMFRMFEQLAHGSNPAGPAAPGLAGFSLLDSLGQLQSGSMMLPGGVRFELPVLEAATISNVLRSLQQSPVMQAVSPLDAVLVDAVAMLFDVVFEEAAIPDRLKAQIGRLQIPVLKAAMLDRNFFSQANHPVRRMLDAIATLSVHLPDNETGNARLEAISHVITGVLDSFEQDIAVFESAAAELEAMGSSLDETLEETLEASLQPDIAQIRQAERAELAPVIVHDFINRALKEQTVADSVREFLRRDWAQLLTQDYVKEGEQGAHFNSHVETMRELIWSVQPKADMDARLMLVRILPGLLKRLREGTAEIELPQKLADRFFATLVVLHANAVRPNTQPVPLPDISPEEIEDMIPAAAAEPAAPAAAEPAVPEVEDEYTQRARALNKGDWVEFHYDDGTFRWARLGWISSIKNTYLFSDQDGMNSFSIGLHRLAEKLRRGEAVLVERKSITESAFGKLMKLFRQKLGYA